jgi:hypothetical protein
MRVIRFPPPRIVQPFIFNIKLDLAGLSGALKLLMIATASKLRMLRLSSLQKILMLVAQELFALFLQDAMEDSPLVLGIGSLKPAYPQEGTMLISVPAQVANLILFQAVLTM